MAELELELWLFDSVTVQNHLGEKNSDYIALSLVFPNSTDGKMIGYRTAQAFIS